MKFTKNQAARCFNKRDSMYSNKKYSKNTMLSYFATSRIGRCKLNVFTNIFATFQSENIAQVSLTKVPPLKLFLLVLKP